MPSCPKCGGRIYIDLDVYGLYVGCMICGYQPAKIGTKPDDDPAILNAKGGGCTARLPGTDRRATAHRKYLEEDMNYYAGQGIV